MRRPGATVCVVDDDASVREALESLMRSAGLGVATYANLASHSADRVHSGRPATVPTGGMP